MSAVKSLRSFVPRPSLQHNLHYEVVYDRADGAAYEPDEHLAVPLQEPLADYDGGEADDYSAAAHVHAAAALVLREQPAGEADHAVGDHEAHDRGGGGVDALGPGHLDVGAGGPQRAAVLGLEVPPEQATTAAVTGIIIMMGFCRCSPQVAYIAAREDQVVLVDAYGQGGLGAGRGAPAHDRGGLSSRGRAV